MTPTPPPAQPTDATPPAPSGGAPASALLSEHHEALLAALRLWLPQQSWYTGGPEPPDYLEIRDTFTLRGDDPELADLLVAAGPTEAEAPTYQVPLVWRHEGAETAGVVAGRPLADATSDPEMMAWLLDRFSSDGDVGGLHFRSGPGLVTGVGEPPLTVTVPQRNTSVMFGECCILKLYRRVEVGPNPEIELTEALAQAGNRQIPTPLGSVRAQTARGPVDLGHLEEFIPSGTDAWRLATASVRDLYAEGDLYAEEVGGDFAAEAFRLGEVLAGIHQDLAGTLGTGVMSAQDAAARIRRTSARLDAVAAEVPGVAELRDALSRELRDAAEAAGGIPIQRIHGDIDLTEVLRTLRGWVVIDFEGNPARPIAERRRRRSPMQDVAGMLRCLDYAARHLLIGMAGDARLAVRARDWITRNRDAVLSGYASVRPMDEAERRMLRVCELDKAVGEAQHEARYRPSWLSVPLGYLAEHEE